MPCFLFRAAVFIHLKSLFAAETETKLCFVLSEFKLCIVRMLVGGGGGGLYVFVCVCVCVCTRTRKCALRIVCTDEILRFTNTLIIYYYYFIFGMFFFIPLRSCTFYSSGGGG